MEHTGRSCSPVECEDCGRIFCACLYQHYPNWPHGVCRRCEPIHYRLRRYAARVAHWKASEFMERDDSEQDQ